MYVATNIVQDRLRIVYVDPNSIFAPYKMNVGRFLPGILVDDATKLIHSRPFPPLAKLVTNLIHFIRRKVVIESLDHLPEHENGTQITKSPRAEERAIVSAARTPSTPDQFRVKYRISGSFPLL